MKISENLITAIITELDDARKCNDYDRVEYMAGLLSRYRDRGQQPENQYNECIAVAEKSTSQPDRNADSLSTTMEDAVRSSVVRLLAEKDYDQACRLLATYADFINVDSST